MPAVTVADITVLPRVNEVIGARARTVKSITTAPQGYEGEAFRYVEHLLESIWLSWIHSS